MIGEWEKEEEELQRAKGTCQSLKWSKANPEEQGWEKSQEFLESGRTSLVQFDASLQLWIHQPSFGPWQNRQ